MVEDRRKVQALVFLHAKSQEPRGEDARDQEPQRVKSQEMGPIDWVAQGVIRGHTLVSLRTGAAADCQFGDTK